MQSKTSAPLKVFCKKEPCGYPCTSTSRTLGLQTSHELSSPLLSVQSLRFSTRLQQPAHNIPTSEHTIGGITPSFLS